MQTSDDDLGLSEDDSSLSAHSKRPASRISLRSDQIQQLTTSFDLIMSNSFLGMEAPSSPPVSQNFTRPTPPTSSQQFQKMGHDMNNFMDFAIMTPYLMADFMITPRPHSRLPGTSSPFENAFNLSSSSLSNEWLSSTTSNQTTGGGGLEGSNLSVTSTLRSQIERMLCHHIPLSLRFRPC
jgi:hypothetical protein